MKTPSTLKKPWQQSLVQDQTSRTCQVISGDIKVKEKSPELCHVLFVAASPQSERVKHCLCCHWPPFSQPKLRLHRGNLRKVCLFVCLDLIREDKVMRPSCWWRTSITATLVDEIMFSSDPTRKISHSITIWSLQLFLTNTQKNWIHPRSPFGWAEEKLEDVQIFKAFTLTRVSKLWVMCELKCELYLYGNQP